MFGTEKQIKWAQDIKVAALPKIEQHVAAAAAVLPEYSAAVEQIAEAWRTQEDAEFWIDNHRDIERRFFGDLSLAIFAHDDGAALLAHLEAADFTIASYFVRWREGSYRMRPSNREHELRQYGNGKIRMFVERKSRVS